MIKAIDFTNNEVAVEYDNVRRYYLAIADLDRLIEDINRAKLMLVHCPNIEDQPYPAMLPYCANCQVASVFYEGDWCQGCTEDEMPF